MKKIVLIDASALVAIINRRDNYYSWSKQTLATLAYPFFTCEAVVTETCFLLQGVQNGEDAVLGLVSSGNIQIAFRLDDETDKIRELMRRYQSVPISLADACLVRMTELYPGSEVLTLDSDFRIYRKNRNQAIVTIMP